jgi:hypothetical protein
VSKGALVIGGWDVVRMRFGGRIWGFWGSISWLGINETFQKTGPEFSLLSDTSDGKKDL